MNALLLTGADGFIGGHLLPAIRSSFRPTLWVGGETKYPPFRVCRVSLTETATYPDRGACDPIEQVIHAAALTKKSNPDATPPELYQAVNVDGTRALLAWLDAQPLAHLLYVSTCDVYGAPAGETSEATTPAPADPYAASKLTGEEVAREYAERRGIPWAVARLGNVYGPGEGAYGKLIPVVIGQALAGQPIRLHGAGATRRDCIYVGDVARALTWIAERRLAGVFNVVFGEADSLATIAKTVVRLAGSSSEIQFDASKPDGPDRTFAPSRLVETGWRPQVALADGLATEIEFQRKQAG
jgi:UDP-glucose 4-epimerase